MKANDDAFRFALNELRGALLHLAADAGGQVDYLRGLNVGDCADELALEFDDAFVPIAQFFGSGIFSPDFERHLENINEILSSMSGESKSDLWRLAALSSRDEWSRVRELSSQAIRLLPGRD